MAIDASFDYDKNKENERNLDLNSTFESGVSTTSEHNDDDALEFKEIQVQSAYDNVDNDEAENVDYWLDLPDELWLKILSYLKQPDLVSIGRTCTKLNKLYTDASLCKIYSSFMKLFLI